MKLLCGYVTIRTVIFDMDGTLLDSETISRISTDYGFMEVLGRKLTDEEHSKLIGRPVQILSKEYYGEAGEKAYLKGQEHFLKNVDKIRPYKGINQLVKWIEQEKIPMAVVTSSHRDSAESLLKMTGLREYFKMVVGQEDTIYHKPDPEPLIYCIKKMKVDPMDCIYIGDQPYDIIASRGAGIRSVGATWGSGIEDVLKENKPDFICKTTDDLMEILKRL
jgi:pyrophosphatase PpaX